MSNVLIYTKDNCPYCDQAKNLLRAKGQTYKETNIGKDITREEFMSTFPGVMTAPFIIINGERVGGYDDLTEWYNGNGQREFLSE